MKHHHKAQPAPILQLTDLESTEATLPTNKIRRHKIHGGNLPTVAHRVVAPNRPSLRNAPGELLPPTRRHDASQVKVSETSPAVLSLFAKNICIREVVLRQTFTPSTPALIDISRQTYVELIRDDTSLTEVLLPEYLDYYATAMAWLRMVTLKQKNSQPITTTESSLLVLTQTTAFNIPEPVLLQIRQLGNVVSGTKQHLYPEFPPLPTNVLNNTGGYYGQVLAPAEGVDDMIHNLYEEIPCLGVTSEAVRSSISNADPGPYQSAVTFGGLQPNSNLLGFRPLGNRRNEPKNLAFYCDITEVVFPSYPANTGFNYQFLTVISNILANTKTFKITPVVFSFLSEIGSQSQLVISRPTDQPGHSCLRGEQIATSLSKDSLTVFEGVMFFNAQLIKDPGPNGDNSSWALFTPAGKVALPPTWIANRNARRNLPIQYMQRVFSSISHQADHFRVNIIKKMVLVKR